MNDVKKYNKERLVFAVVDGALMIRPEECSELFCYQWLEKQFDITADQFEDIVHGSVFKDGHTVFGKGKDYAPIDMENVSQDTLKSIVKISCEWLAADKVSVWNGAKPGEVGAIWDPIEDLGDFAATV